MNITTTTARMWLAANELAAAIRSDWKATTGRKWRRPARECPPWCGQGHVCSAAGGYPSGQHRSMPACWETSYGSLVATRVARVGGANTIEVRAVVALPEGEDAAGQAAQGLLTAVHLTITSLTVDRPATVHAGVRAADRRGLPAAAGGFAIAA